MSYAHSFDYSIAKGEFLRYNKLMFKFFRWLFHLGKPVLEYTDQIISPDGRTVLEVVLKNGQIFYSISTGGKVLVRPSRLSINLRGEDPLGNGLMLVREVDRTHDETWETKWGEERYIVNKYNEQALYLSESGGKKRLFTLRFRVFNEGVAFRYEIPPQPEFQRLIVQDEVTEFNIDNNSYAWHIPAYQPDRYEYNYTRDAIYELTGSVHTPLTLEHPSGYFLSIHRTIII